MHRLESLGMVGFKSFCEKTSIEFNDRITSIVGPNGCGKSNIAEAISWVLGEQRPRSLRSDRMEDVIFNGTAVRKAVGFVEVALTLKPIRSPEAADDGIPVDNLTVTRRLYRSGESEYLLNDRRCRLLDIHQTFEGTGLGFTSYAIIEQGRIGTILTSKPVERRSLIEEAAKIISFRQKRKSAEIKLELARQNLLRVNDIILEIERQLRSLKRQASRAQAFSRLREEMRAFHRIKLHQDYQGLRSSLEDLQARLRELQAQEDLAAATLREREQAARQARLAHSQRLQEMESCREQLSLAVLELEKSLQTRQSQQQQIEMARAQAGILEQDLREWERRLSETGVQFQAKSSLRDDLAREVMMGGEQIEQLKREDRQFHEQIDLAEERLDSVRTCTLEEAAQKATLKNQQSQVQQDLAALEAREARIVADREKLGGRCSELQAAEALALEECCRIQQQIEQSIRLQQELEGALAEALTRESALAQELQSLREQYSGHRHRLASIEEIEVRRANYSEGVQKFLTFIQQRRSLRSSGTLADHIETDPQYEALVETFLDNQLEFVLVEGVPDALSGLEQLRESHAGKCTFLALASGNGFDSNGGRYPACDPERGIVGTLGALLKMEEPVRRAFYRALPQHANAVVVEDLGRARQVSREYPDAIFVTLAGETWTERGVISGVGEASRTSGLLTLKRQKRELIARAGTLQKQIPEVETQLAQVKEERGQVESRQKGQRDLVHAQEKELISWQHEYNRVLSDLQREEQAARVFSQELVQVHCEREQLVAESARIGQELQQLARTGLDREQECARVQETLAELRRKGEELGRLLAEKQSDLAAKLERKQGADQEWARLAEEESRLTERWQRHKKQLADALERIDELQKSNEQLAVLSGQLQAQKEDLEAELDRHRADAAALEERLQDLQAALEQAHADRESALEQRMQLEVGLARLSSDCDHLQQHCLDEFGASIEELSPRRPEGWDERSYEEIRAEFERLKAKVEEFGPINMSALEEYRENEERFNFLSHQRQDIESSIADTNRAIQEINRRSREQFLEAFDAINAHFQATFQVLFGGGECGMALLDESDTWESGIDIYAQPPGKKLQNLLLLSGGEKALIAFALLIAIFKYRPSPFCVLDEVDAPLDEANIARFTNLVQHMSDRTQFIIITHNKKTMEISRSIYGITMEEAGVSKVVSVNFN